MAFLKNLFSRTPKVPLPTLEALLEARGIAEAPVGLEALQPDFDHLDQAPEREAWADAVVELHRQGLPLPRPWQEILEEAPLLPELLPAWQAEREGCFQRPVAEGLAQAIRAGDRRVRPQDLRLWHVEPSEILERALDHLRELSKGGTFERQPSGIYRSRFGDGQDALRILLPELWSNLFPGQNLFLTAPAPNVLWVAPQVLLPKLVEATQQVIAANPQPRLLGVMYQWVHESLIPANLQDPHPMAQAQRELRQKDLLSALAAQDRDLDPALGLPVEVAIITTQQGRTFTLATWPAGRPVLLPETDLIAFHGPDQAPLGLFWRQHLPRIPELKGVPVAIWGPRRQRFEGFPTAEQLDRMEAFVTAEQLKAMQAQAAQKPAPAPAPAAQGHARPASLHGVTLGVQDDEAR